MRNRLFIRPVHPIVRSLTMAFMLVSFYINAQQQLNTEKPPQSAVAENVAALTTASTAANIGPSLLDASEVLRVEQTIRANKEQPQVLTIVPWQLPTHQRINETTTWQPAVEKLPIIERNQFLRDLAVLNNILSEPAKVSENIGANVATDASTNTSSNTSTHVTNNVTTNKAQP